MSDLLLRHNLLAKIAAEPPVPPVPTCETVDLGLSVKWATKNIGAESESDYGNYYAWGELAPKENYSQETYTYEDTPTVLPEDRDIATRTYGPNFRMPTQTEIEELANTMGDTTNYSWTWKEVEGNNCWEIKYLGNNNSILLPAAGLRYDTDLDYTDEYGYYWSSSIDTEDPHDAWHLNFDLSYAYCDSLNRYNGYSVRPVEVIPSNA